MLISFENTVNSDNLEVVLYGNSLNTAVHPDVVLTVNSLVVLGVQSMLVSDTICCINIKGGSCPPGSALALVAQH